MTHFGEKIYIGTTRFSNSTFEENSQWRNKHKWDGCIYGVNKKTSPSVPRMALVYVLEMNNDTNTIEGIGLVRNYINLKYKPCIYTSDLNYNRYIYNSKYRIERNNIKYKKVLELLEIIVFTGSGHYKRGQGITIIDWNKFNMNTIKLLKIFFQQLFNNV
jgi:hypothetical protein